MNNEILNPGDKVTYTPTYGPQERGVVKSISGDPDYVFVVYHCGGEWDRYSDFTAARTRVQDLKRGWDHE